MPNEIEIFQYYENLESVRELVKLANGKQPCDEETRWQAAKCLNDFTNQAMTEAGLNTTPGQIDFADALFFDFAAPFKEKLMWLADYPEKYKERIKYLKMRIAEAGRIPDRMTIA